MAPNPIKRENNGVAWASNKEKNFRVHSVFTYIGRHLTR